jgi:hypothetical protein
VGVGSLFGSQAALAFPVLWRGSIIDHCGRAVAFPTSAQLSRPRRIAPFGQSGIRVRARAELCDDGEVERNPLWLGEVNIVRAIFGHAANADADRLLGIAPKGLTGKASRVALEERIQGRRLDVLVAFADDDEGRGSGWSWKLRSVRSLTSTRSLNT